MQVLASIAGPDGGWASGINDAGQVIGQGAVFPSGDQTGAFLLQNGQVIEIGPACTHAEAFHINNLGQVVGVCYDGAGGHAYLWKDTNGNGISDPGEMIDLNTLIPSGSVTVGLTALAINDAQQIVGSASLPGSSSAHAVMLTPSAAVISTDRLPDGSVGSAYSAALAASYGSTPYTWSLAPGSQPLPPGLNLASTGLIIGSPTMQGTFPIVVQLTDGMSATATRGLSIRIFPFTLSAYGSAYIDGVLHPTEWEHAGCQTILVSAQGGPALGFLCAMNDSQNLYLSLRVESIGPELAASSFSVDFDNNNDGRAENGDDVLVATSYGFFGDAFRTNAFPCDPSSPVAACESDDRADGGTTDGAGAFANDGTDGTYEMSHPLNSGDAAHDVALQPGDAAGFFVTTRPVASSDDNAFFVPGFRDYARIIVTATQLAIPADANVVVTPADPSNGATPVMIAFDEVTQPGVTGFVSSTTGPAPSGFWLGVPPVYYDLYTTGAFTAATVCINYAGINFPPGMRKLWHYEGGVWKNVTISDDTVNKILCGRVTSFSPFTMGVASTGPRVPTLTWPAPADITPHLGAN